LDNLIKSGFSPYEAIKAGTKNAAMSLNRINEFGTVSVGKRGDLILLDKNPLIDVNNLKSIAGVMVRGTWLPKTALDTLLGSIANSN
jgi:imidazolonepropionase-like amidohydrolase